MLATANTHEVLLDTIRQSFVERSDGYFYPVEPGTPLVRIVVARDSYSIERRRNAGSSWMPIVTAYSAEFDPGAFATWRSAWPVVA